MKIELVGDWKEAWKWMSVQAGVVMAILSSLYASFPNFQNLMDAKTYAWVMAALGALIPIFRIISQGGSSEKIVPDNSGEL